MLQLFNRESRSALEFDAVNREHMQAYKDAIIAYGWFYPVVEFISMIAWPPFSATAVCACNPGA